MKMKTIKYFLPLALIILFALTGMSQKSKKEDQNKKYSYFENPSTCSGCHWDRFDRWNTSQHSKGFTGDFFQAQFYDVVLPSLDLDPKLANVKDDCIGCHSPTAFLSGDMEPVKTTNPDNHWNRGDGNKSRADRGIFCDFCHTLDHFKNNPA